MTIIVLTLSISFFIALGFLAGFIWAVRSGQFVDTHTPAVRILIDNEEELNGTTDERF